MKNDGFTLIEVMVAMVIAGIALMGTLGAVEVSSRHVQQGSLNSKAIELVQARLEAKRSVRWQSLLEDDLDFQELISRDEILREIAAVGRRLEADYEAKTKALEERARHDLGMISVTETFYQVVDTPHRAPDDGAVPQSIQAATTP